MKRFLPAAFCVFFGVGAITVAADTYATRDADAPYTEHIGPLYTEQTVRIPLIEAVAITPRIEIPAMPTAHEVALAALETEHRCLSEVLYYEARGEGAVGQEAVAEVVFNRLRDRAYPHSICGIVYQGSECAFLPVRVCLRWRAQPAALCLRLGLGRNAGGPDSDRANAAGRAYGRCALLPCRRTGAGARRSCERTIQIGKIRSSFRDAPKSRGELRPSFPIFNA